MALPEMVGGAEFADLPPSVVTTDVAVDVEVVLPCLLLAVTRMRRRKPRSCEAVVYPDFVAPLTFVQLFVDESSPASAWRRSHWYLN